MPLLFNSLTLCLDIFEIIYKYLNGRSEASRDVNESEQHMLALNKENFKELIESNVADKVAEVEEENRWSTGDPGETSALSTQFQPVGAHGSSTASNALHFDVLTGEVPTRTIEPFKSGSLRAYTSASDLLRSTRSFGHSSSSKKDSAAGGALGDTPRESSFSNPGWREADLIRTVDEVEASFVM
jgi:hypothetical protein